VVMAKDKNIAGSDRSNKPAVKIITFSLMISPSIVLKIGINDKLLESCKGA
jgi:hypothetical protein